MFFKQQNNHFGDKNGGYSGAPCGENGDFYNMVINTNSYIFGHQAVVRRVL